MTETVSKECVCNCGERWVYVKPKGKRGQTPKTNPDHPKCKTIRDNRKRATRRAQAKSEGVSESERSREGWKLPKASGITEDGRKALQEATTGHYEWRRDRRRDAYAIEVNLFEGSEVLTTRELLEHQGLSSAPCMDDHVSERHQDWQRFRYIPKATRDEVKKWLSAHEMPSQECTGTPGPNNSEKGSWSPHVLGSMEPWHLAVLPRMGAMQRLPRMERFVMSI